MGGIGHDDFGAFKIFAGVVISAGRHNAREFPVRAGRRLQGERGKPRNFL